MKVRPGRFILDLLTTVTLLTTPKTVAECGSIFVSGLARSKASLNLSSGTWRECKYLTPLRKTDSWILSLSSSSSWLNSCATFSLLRIAMSMSFPRLSTASRYAMLHMSEETKPTSISTPRVEWLSEEFCSRPLVWRVLWLVWAGAASSLAVVDCWGASRVWSREKARILDAACWETESRLLARLAQSD